MIVYDNLLSAYHETSGLQARASPTQARATTNAKGVLSLPKYRFTWDAFDDSTVTAVARACGFDAATAARINAGVDTDADASSSHADVWRRLG